jgi:hypothetical protein
MATLLVRSPRARATGGVVRDGRRKRAGVDHLSPVNVVDVDLRDRRLRRTSIDLRHSDLAWPLRAGAALASLTLAPSTHRRCRPGQRPARERPTLRKLCRRLPLRPHSLIRSAQIASAFGFIPAKMQTIHALVKNGARAPDTQLLFPNAFARVGASFLSRVAVSPPRGAPMLPSVHSRRRLPQCINFRAQSHGLFARCLRFAAFLPGCPVIRPRKTRFRLLVSLCRTGSLPLLGPW